MTAPAADRRSSRFVRAVAAHALPSQLTGPSVPLDDEEWAEVLMEVDRQRLAGLLAQAVLDGAFAVTPAQQAELRHLHFGATVNVLRLEHRLALVADTLARSGVAFRVLKGPAFSRLVYEDPSSRLFADIDILVAGDQLDACIDALVADGCERRHGEPRPRFDSRFSKGVELTAPDGVGIDVHRTFVSGPFGLWVDLDALFENAQHIEVEDRTVAALGPDEALLHACFHAALGDWPPRLVPLRDVAQQVSNGDVDDERLLRIARAWRAEVVVAHAVREAWERLGLLASPPLVRWAQQRPITRRERRALSVYQGSRRSYERQMVAQLQAIPGLRAKVAFMSAILLPSQTYLDRREGSYARRLGRSVRTAVRKR